MKRQNVVLISVEELRADHLSCCGYDRVETTHMDSIAKEGTLFETCISASSFTGICMASVLTGLIPPLHGSRRDPYSVFSAKPVASILQDRGYETAAFVGIGAVAQQFGFGQGFDHYDEPTEEVTYFRSFLFPDLFYVGNWWIDKMLEWLRSHLESNFFIWGHIYETHEGSQWPLLERGMLKEGELAEFGYHDAKLRLVDEEVFGPLLSLLKELGVYDTVIVFTGDHATNLGEHPAEPIPHRPNRSTYPQHYTLYDCDIKVPLVVKGKGVPRGHLVKGMVRSIDVVPTLLDLVGIETIHQFSGISLLPAIERGKSSGLVAYAEELFPKRGPGDFQALRTNRHKYIIDRRHGDAEEFYDLEKDPDEQVNIIDVLSEDEQLVRKEMREVADFHIAREMEEKGWSEEEREKIDKRLRALGYIH